MTVGSPSEEYKMEGWKGAGWGKKVKVDLPLSEANADTFDALVLPGGVMNPDHLRRDPQVLAFVKSFFTAGKPVGAICHGPWTLIDAGVVRGRKMTSYETIQTDLKNPGPIGWTKKWWGTRASSRAASRMICPPSTGN